MKICKYCGQSYAEIKNDIEDIFCPYCGKEYHGEVLPEIIEDNNQFETDYIQNRKRYWLGLGLYLGIFYLGAVIIQVIVSLIVMAIGGYNNLDPGTSIYQEYETHVLAWSNFLIYFVAIAAITPLIWKTLKTDFENFKNNLGYNFKWFGIGIGIMYAGVYSASILITVITFIFGLEAGESANQTTIETIMQSSLLNGLLMCIMTIFFAPFLEEIIFRRCLFGIFKNKSFTTVIISAIIFAGIHTVPTCLMMIPDLFSGDATFDEFFLEFIYILNYMGQAFALSYTYYKTKGNLIPCIMIHMANNIIATLVILFATYI